MKRAFDFVAASIGLILLFPFLILVAIAIKLSDFGPVFFPQWRIGRGGKPFRMLKFRSMKAKSLGPALTIGADSRITPLGRILRRTKLDELPQLWNVVCGQMSLVGPRPEIEKYTSLYTPEQRRVLQLTPGITDPASFAFFDESELLAKSADPETYYVKILMPEKIRINLEYASKRGMLNDWLVIIVTILKPVGVKIDMFSLLRLTPPHQ